MQAKEKPVLVIASQKGGVGKTATAAALIDCFRAQGLRVLGVDCDPQGNLSNVQKDYIVDGCASTDELFFGKPIAVRADGQATTLAYEEIEGLRAGGGVTERSLGETIQREMARLGFDLCIIDTHPDKSFAVLSALVAASHVLIPTRPAGNEVMGVQMMVGFLNDLAAQTGKDWTGRIASAVTLCRRTRMAAEVTAQIREVFPAQGIKVFDTVIHQYQMVDTAQTRGESIFREGEVLRDAANEYRWLADEVLSWMDLSMRV